MDFNNITKKPYINNLRCSNCKNYLSHFPIFLANTNLNICGRCQLPKNSICTRNEIYELIASDIAFPCRYVDEGCMEKLCPKEIATHEKTCPFRRVKCPAANCNDLIGFPKLTQHCTDVHSDVILKNSEFELDLSSSAEKSNILIHNGKFFVFMRKLDAENCRFYHQVRYFEEDFPTTNNYEIIMRNEERSCTFKGTVGKKCYDQVNLEILINTPDDLFVQGKITFDPHNNEVVPVIPQKMSEELLKMVQCSKCFVYIKPPVRVYFYNKKPHCNSCALNSYEATATTRFYGLDELMQQLIYPCKNQKDGCDFKSPPESIINHELYCLYSKTTCPLNDICSWNGLGKDVVSHLNKTHSTSFAKSEQISGQHTWNNVPSGTKNYYLVRFANHYFRLGFWAQNNQFYWTMQMIGEFEDSFRYKLELIGEDSKKIVSVQSVGPPMAINMLFRNVKEYCCFRLDQIESILNVSARISFKIRVFKV